VTLSIVIVTYESARVIESCIASIGVRSPHRILVVDNGSSDDSAARARRCGVEVIELGTNLGFGQAATVGARGVADPVLCFLNPDCEANPAVFDAGLHAIGERPDRCAVPFFVHPDGTVVSGVQPGYTRTKLCADMLQTNGVEGVLWRFLHGRRWYDARSWSWPIGACMFIGRDLFLRAGGFDPRFFMYMEDVELGFGLHRMGAQLITLNTRVAHGVGSGSSITSEKRLALLNCARLDFARLHYGRAFAQLMAFVLIFARYAGTARAVARRLRRLSA